MKTSDLIGPALDWAVAKAQGVLRSDVILMSGGELCAEGLLPLGYCPAPESFFDIRLSAIAFSTDWAQGGPIIEREKIDVQVSCVEGWCAYINNDELTADLFMSRGDTPLISAMRCFVTAKLGDEIEIPKELL